MQCFSRIRAASIAARLATGLLLGAIVAPAIAREDDKYWDGRFAYPGGAGVNAAVTALASANGKVYAAGSFTQVGDVVTSYVAQWDGVHWSALPSTHPPLSLFCSGSSVIATYISSMDLWNGQAWSYYYGCLSEWLGWGYGYYYTLAAAGTDGNSTWVCESWYEEVEHSSIWTDFRGFRTSKMGSPGVREYFVPDHQPLGDGVLFDGGNGNVAANDHDIYCGAHYYCGYYFSEAYITRSYVVWAPLGDFVVRFDSGSALALDGKRLYVGGCHRIVDGETFNNVACWDGNRWQSVGGGADGTVTDLVASSGDLYVAGAISQAGETSVSNIARWDGSEWSALGSGTNGRVTCLAQSGRAVIAGGDFTMAGNRPSNKIAIWRPRVNTTTSVLSLSPGAVTLGNDPYGYYRPALMTGSGTTICYAGSETTTFTLDQADVTTVGGCRVNGAFRLSPCGTVFGGDGAVLHVEFDDDDVLAYGTTYTEFRATRIYLDEASDPARQRCELLGTAMPAPVRVDNGHQIYGIDVPLIEAGGVYAAIPLSLAGSGPADAPNLTGKWSILRNRKAAGRSGLTASLAVANTGSQDASSYSVRFYLSPVDVVTPESILVKNARVPRQRKGRTARLSVNYASGPRTDLIGWRLIAVIDADNAVTEQRESDNLAVTAPLPW